jgi:hypothetical protein
MKQTFLFYFFHYKIKHLKEIFWIRPVRFVLWDETVLCHSKKKKLPIYFDYFSDTHQER